MRYLVLLSLLFFCFGCVGTFNNGASVHAGVEVASGADQYCVQRGVSDYKNNDKLVSNLGLEWNVWQYDRLGINVQYTHHSCVFNPDADVYDGVGAELEWRLW